MSLDELDQANELEYMDVEAMRDQLRQAFRDGHASALTQDITRSFEDPVQPETKRGRWRPHPLLLIWGALLIAALAIFLFTTFSPR